MVSTEPDPELARTAATIAGSVRVAGPDELAALLARLADVRAPVIPRSLDLFGHSTNALLRLGDWVIDGGDPAVPAFFFEQRPALAALGIHMVRLIACHTAGTDRARDTLRAIARATGAAVYGTTQLIYDAHHDAEGFLDAWSFLLIGAHELAAPDAASHAVAPFDLAALPALPLTGLRPPVRLATAATARDLMALVGRDAGGRLAAATECELALPATSSTYHRADVVMDGAFVRFYPDRAGVAYPVRDPARLSRLVESITE